jgi:hypothetical protein
MSFAAITRTRARETASNAALLKKAYEATLNAVLQYHGIAYHWKTLTDALGRALEADWRNASNLAGIVGSRRTERESSNDESNSGSSTQKSGRLPLPEFPGETDALGLATGYGFDYLTESEARALTSFRPSDTVRNRIIAQGNVGSDGLDGQGTGEGSGSVLKSSPTSDVRYLELTENPEKNKGALQAMVNDAAKVAGYDFGIRFIDAGYCSNGNFKSAKQEVLMEDPTDYDPTPNGGKDVMASLLILERCCSLRRKEESTLRQQRVFLTAAMNSPMNQEQQQEPLKEPSDKTKSFVELLEEGRQETLKRGFHVNLGLGKLVPRSSLNYQEKDS